MLFRKVGIVCRFLFFFSFYFIDACTTEVMIFVDKYHTDMSDKEVQIAAILKYPVNSRSQNLPQFFHCTIIQNNPD